MVRKENYGKIINFTINIFLGIGLTTVGLYKNKLLSIESFMTGFVVSMGIGYIICDLIPALGPIATKSMKDSLPKNLLTTAVTGFVYIFLISFFNLFSTTGFQVLHVWPKLFPVLFIIGYVILLLFMPICVKIADWLTQ